jgi:hypothetical protein
MLGLAAGAADARQAPPTLLIESGAESNAVKERLLAYDPRPLADIVRLVGLADAGSPVRVVLASDNSNWGARVPHWVAGYAVGEADLVVLFPSRSPTYPQDSLEDVLRHEVAHVLIGRAAGGQPIPRWFHEGLAVAVERPRSLEDRARLAGQLLFGHRSTLDDLSQLFGGSQGAQSRAYAVSAAIVRDLMDEHGHAAPAAILRDVADGQPFAVALARVTGRSVQGFERDFWDRHRGWTMWIPLLGSTSLLWIAVIGLAALARRRRRARAAELRRRWEAEETEP